MSAPFHYAEIMSRLVNTPLLAHPRKAAIVYNALCGRFGAPPLDGPAMSIETPQASRFVGGYLEDPSTRHGVEPFKFEKGVGIVTITGSLVNRGAWVGSNSGVTSYEGIRHQIARAGRHPKVKALILDMHTPGGEAVGAMETSAMVREVAAVKPVVAVVNGMAASAGYAIAAGARRIIMTETGIAGSIGTVLIHLDYSKFLEDAGVKPTLIFAGAHKVDGNPFEPLSDDVKADLTREVQLFNSKFLDTVARGRKGRTSAKAARDTEARTFIGQEAVDAKLADDVGTFEQVLAQLSRRAAA